VIRDKIGRSVEISKILKHLDNIENKLLTIKGIPGMYKIDLVELIAQHVNQRNNFRNGVIKIRVGANYKTRSILNKMEEIFIQNGLIIVGESDDETQDDFKIIMKRLINAMKKLNLLIVLINVNFIIIKEGDVIFKEFLENVLTNCQEVKFLMTSG
jgi:hypothetical protein